MKNIYNSVLVVLILIVALFFLLKGTKPEETPELPQIKIDVRTACMSALTYTTFMSNEDAEMFIAECVEGKHPDVIQRYVESLGLDGANI